MAFAVCAKEIWDSFINMQCDRNISLKKYRVVSNVLLFKKQIALMYIGVVYSCTVHQYNGTSVQDLLPERKPKTEEGKQKY